MNQPPDHSMISKLAGHVIDAITVMRYKIDFICEDQNYGFSISSPLCLGPCDQVDAMDWTEFPLSTTEAPRILGSTILSAGTDGDNSLRIGVSTGDTVLASWDANYESYGLKIDGIWITI